MCRETRLHAESCGRVAGTTHGRWRKQTSISDLSPFCVQPEHSTGRKRWHGGYFRDLLGIGGCLLPGVEIDMVLLRTVMSAFVFLGIASSVSAQTAQQSQPKIAWIINCASSGQSTELTCSMSQRIADSKTGNVILTVSVQSNQSSKATAILVNLAHGFSLTDGLKLQVDEGKTISLAFQTSTPQGLVAAIPLSEDLLVALRKGNVLKVTATQYNPRKSITFPISLSGFSSANSKLSSIK